MEEDTPVHEPIIPQKIPLKLSGSVPTFRHLYDQEDILQKKDETNSLKLPGYDSKGIKAQAIADEDDLKKAGG